MFGVFRQFGNQILEQVILEGQVKVDGEICTMRGKKLKGGEQVTFNGKAYICIMKE